MELEILERFGGGLLVSGFGILEEVYMNEHFENEQTGELKLLHSPIRKLSKFFEKAKEKKEN